jgi:hypothetical protein
MSDMFDLQTEIQEDQQSSRDFEVESMGTFKSLDWRDDFIMDRLVKNEMRVGRLEDELKRQNILKEGLQRMILDLLLLQDKSQGRLKALEESDEVRVRRNLLQQSRPARVQPRRRRHPAEFAKANIDWVKTLKRVQVSQFSD